MSWTQLGSVDSNVQTGHQSQLPEGQSLLKCSGQGCRHRLFVDCSRCQHEEKKCTIQELAWNRGGFFEQKSRWWCSHCMKGSNDVGVSGYVTQAKTYSKLYFR